ncbi:MAG: penicillin-binding protein 2 [Deltaproteobacteria bacterium]|nr:penicillin-binding protein 2 [Deltaproteobacteria bacterium]
MKHSDLLDTYDPEEHRLRISIFAISMAVVVLLLLVHLWYLQIIKGQEYKHLSENNRVRFLDVLPARGLILDRNGILLADNRPSYNLAVTLEDVPDPDALVANLSKILDTPATLLEERINKARNVPFKSYRIKSDIQWDELAKIETNKLILPGVSIEIEPRRNYVLKSAASHMIGYLGEITLPQLKSGRYTINKPGDQVGKSGIEKEWQVSLNGQRGQRQIEVDAAGRELKELSHQDPTPGSNLYLTIDIRLQMVAEEALRGNAGAIVAMDPRNGSILAMASSPAFDQNVFVRGLTSGEWKDLVNRSDHPLENRAIQGQYPPGSTFKIITAIAGLEKGVITPDTRLSCSGSYALGNGVYRCWRKGGHGSINLHRAIVDSCDVYFYKVGQKLGVDNIATYARDLGLGQVTGINLANEKPGLVPDREWKLRRFKESWQKGETLPVAIGQGFDLATPLQMAQVISAMANKGIIYKPTVVAQIEKVGGGGVTKVAPEVLRHIDASPRHIEAVRNGLLWVVEGGTGTRAKIPGIKVAGKTGTAQVIKIGKTRLKLQQLPYKYRDHAWFVAFAPYDSPEIAVSVLMEHAGHGGSTAGPIAKRVIEAFLALKNNSKEWDQTLQTLLKNYTEDPGDLANQFREARSHVD